MLGHISFKTSRMEESIRFYKDLFGFAPVFSLKDDQGNPWIEYLMDPEGTFIELFYSSIIEPAPEQDDNHPYSHFCYEVANIEEIIGKAGDGPYHLHKPLKKGRDDNLQCWFRDPNGQLVEVMQMSPDSPQMKFRKQCMKPERG